MRWILPILSLLLFLNLAVAQEASVDTSQIYVTADDMPRFPGCEGQFLEGKELADCASTRLLQFVYQNIRYPDTARMEGIEGTVVVRFVVDENGNIAQSDLLKDIGGGCGVEALRVINGMNTLSERWTPGSINGGPVKVYFTLPIKFKLQEPQYFYVDGQDSIYTRVDSIAVFKGSDKSFKQYIVDNLKYPASGKDSCEVGQIDAFVMVRQNGQVLATDIYNYNNLSFDFEAEVTRSITASVGSWQPAIFKGQQVTTTFPISVEFSPPGKGCKANADKFIKARQNIKQGKAFLMEQDTTGALQQLNEAVAAFPNNGGFLLERGQLLVAMDRLDEACADFKIVEAQLIRHTYSNLLPFICKEKETTTEEK